MTCAAVRRTRAGGGFVCDDGTGTTRDEAAMARRTTSDTERHDSGQDAEQPSGPRVPAVVRRRAAAAAREVEPDSRVAPARGARPVAPSGGDASDAPEPKPGTRPGGIGSGAASPASDADADAGVDAGAGATADAGSDASHNEDANAGDAPETFPAAVSRRARQAADGALELSTGHANRLLGAFVQSEGELPVISRRHLLAAGAGVLAGAAVLGLGSLAWWTHRAVSCTVNGTEREVPVGSRADYLLRKGYATPVSGNLVSIADADGKVTTLQYGAGNPYTLQVNGQPADAASYRVAPEDAIEFVNGTDVTEDVSRQDTKIPCGIEIPPDTDLLNVIAYVAQWGKDGVSTVETGKTSGVTVDRGVTTEPQDLVIKHSPVNPEGRSLVALTFDDGPDPTFTPQYLDILARYGAHATFFNLGSVLEKGDEYKALAKRCADEGHQVASHTYSHSDATLSGMDEATRATEISRAFKLVSDATGVPTQVMRAPYGEFRGWQFLQYVANHGDIAYAAYWGVDSQDWEQPGADAIVQNCTRNANTANYNGAVILMHDGGSDRSQDVEALPRIIETFQNLGYELVTLNEMLAADPTFPSWVSAGVVERPADAVIPDVSKYVH